MGFRVVQSIVAAAAAALTLSAGAAEITGAGASFPAPVYAKWAEAYEKATGTRINYQSIGSSGGLRGGPGGPPGVDAVGDRAAGPRA